MPRPLIPQEQNVFLNVPFNRSYEPLFLALIASITALGRRPRSVLQIAEGGEGRLDRIFKQMEKCSVSIHDLSCVGTPVRFNMPFELGLACAMRRYRNHHAFIMLERKHHRLDKTLSDIKGRDPLIHGGKPRVVISCVLSALGTSSGNPEVADVYSMWRQLSSASAQFKSMTGSETIFSRLMFNDITGLCIRLAQGFGLIE